MNAAQLSPLGSDNSLVTHWIGGSRSTTSPGRRCPVFNPAQGRQVREVALATAAEVDAAVQIRRRRVSRLGRCAAATSARASCSAFRSCSIRT